ncbi:MAG: ATP-binding protein [Acidobacteria bacterium]|nr:ATP-binding protein [Acidobacteriota bacterium]
MMASKGGKTRRFSVVALAVLLLAAAAAGERLPIKTYTIADGLARDFVRRIKQDSHGFIWLCTAEGLSRFDGYGFTNYGLDDGLPSLNVTEFLETRAGEYFFGTQAGLVRFDPENSRFTPIETGPDKNDKYIVRLVEDRDGTIWAGTLNRLFRLAKAEDSWRAAPVETDLVLEKGFYLSGIGALMIDRRGALWIATSASGLFRRFPDGRFEHYTEKNGLSQNGVSDVFEDRDGRIWVGTGLGLTLLVADPRPGQNIAARVYTAKDGLFRDHIETIFQSSDGRLWIGNRGGLNYLADAGSKSGAAFRGYTARNGLPQVRILTIAEDRDSNLWFGGDTGGAMKLPLGGFTSYFEDDGLGTAGIEQIFRDRADDKYVLNFDPKTLFPLIAHFTGDGFVDETPAFPPATKFGWGTNQLTLQDSAGDWWVGTLDGLFRFAGEPGAAGLKNLRLKRHYDGRDGIDSTNIFRLFEDARGDVWFSTIGDGARKSLHRWDRRTDKIVAYDLPSLGIPLAAATAFANDAEGNLWMGFYTGGIARYRDGQFTCFAEKDGVPEGFVNHLFFDDRQRLWIATARSGVARADEPLAERPEFVRYTTKDGISSNQVTTVAEDRFGRIYLGTGRGIDRLEPETGRLKRFTTADGLADNYINCSLADAGGTLWFGTFHGLSRFVPQPDRPREKPETLISAVRAGGVRQKVSAFGQTEVALPELGYTENQLEIDFLSISNAAGDFLRYQYKFDGTDWSAPAEQRTVTLPNLPPGGYRFLVRAVDSDNRTSDNPAVVTFRILPPVWKRWWFIALCALALTLIIMSFYRYRTARLHEINAASEEARRAEEKLRRSREERLAELEQVRTRIATDLHDDIGASLTQIAILSEVARQQNKASNGAGTEPLTMIYDVSNELVSTMSDIVWSINPHKDRLHDLTLRMRRFASDVLAAKEIDFEFEAPEEAAEIPLNSNLRREVFLIFKEAVNNIVRHSGARQVEIRFEIDDRELRLTVRDNGRGFAPETNGTDPAANLFADYRGGNGLLNMRRRAAELGGELRIASEQGRGTTVFLRLPAMLRAGGGGADKNG